MPNDLPERKFELPPRAFVRQFEMPMDGIQQFVEKIHRAVSALAAWKIAYDLGIVKFGCQTSEDLERLLELKYETDRIVREWGIR